MKLLLVEDEKITRITLANTLADEGYRVTSCETGVEGLEKIKSDKFEIIVADLRLPKISGLDLLKEAKELQPGCKVIVMTAYASVETAVEALKYGAYDYLIKPFSPDKLLATLNNIRRFKKIQDENIHLKQRLGLFENRTIIGGSRQILKLMETIKVVAKNDYTVLIQGESGTGKELVARALHFYGPRVNGAFIPINCSAIPENLLESELFGHEKGAFTGAVKTHVGLFERADGGTLFLDDIDDFPFQLQVKLLRVLQEKEITRVGGTKSIKVNVRVIVATKVDLQELVDESKFRQDLYYRLNIIPLKAPPLRDRKEDIPLLAEHFFIKRDAKEKVALLTPTVLKKMKNYDWPGNVRELENFVERMIALSDMEDWENELFAYLSSGETIPQQVETEEKDYPTYEIFLGEKEKEIFSWAIRKTKGNVSKAASLLGLPRSTFRSKLEKLNLE
ncbi:MAG: sigma-54-dependent Fis family transcriptional regulator [Chlorobi bacterium]|nr:sigma-54-dependent Fis family transcriptional regulator [Chlorobiota bacterium]